MSDLVIDVSAVTSKSGGVWRYSDSLVRALRLLGVDPTLICSTSAASDWSGAIPIAPSLPRRLLWEQYGVNRSLRRAGIAPDVLHGVHYSIPHSRSPSFRRVVTFHDLTWFSHPEWHTKVKRHWFPRVIRHAVRNADAVICVSDRTATGVQTRFEPRCPVYVAPHGVDPAIFRPAGELDAVLDATTLRSLEIKQPYVLFTGAVEPRKNLPNLVDAVAALRADVNVQLVVAGLPWDSYDTTFLNREHVRHLGFVPEEHLPTLYRRAAVFCYPSFEEGFGLPVLEALASGVPVVTSQDTVMADVAGGAAYLVDPHSQSDISLKLRAAFDAPEDHRQLGLSLARRLSWEHTARQHMIAYGL